MANGEKLQRRSLKFISHEYNAAEGSTWTCSNTLENACPALSCLKLSTITIYTARPARPTSPVSTAIYLLSLTNGIIGFRPINLNELSRIAAWEERFPLSLQHAKLSNTFEGPLSCSLFQEMSLLSLVSLVLSFSQLQSSVQALVLCYYFNISSLPCHFLSMYVSLFYISTDSSLFILSFDWSIQYSRQFSESINAVSCLLSINLTPSRTWRG